MKFAEQATERAERKLVVLLLTRRRAVRIAVVNDNVPIAELQDEFCDREWCRGTRSEPTHVGEPFGNDRVVGIADFGQRFLVACGPMAKVVVSASQSDDTLPTRSVQT